MNVRCRIGDLRSTAERGHASLYFLVVFKHTCTTHSGVAKKGGAEGAVATLAGGALH